MAASLRGPRRLAWLLGTAVVIAVLVGRFVAADANAIGGPRGDDTVCRAAGPELRSALDAGLDDEASLVRAAIVASPAYHHMFYVAAEVEQAGRRLVVEWAVDDPVSPRIVTAVDAGAARVSRWSGFRNAAFSRLQPGAEAARRCLENGGP